MEQSLPVSSRGYEGFLRGGIPNRLPSLGGSLVWEREICAEHNPANQTHAITTSRQTAGNLISAASQSEAVLPPNSGPFNARLWNCGGREAGNDCRWQARINPRPLSSANLRSHLPQAILFTHNLEDTIPGSMADITYEDKKIHDPNVSAREIDATPEKMHVVEELAEETGALKFVEDDTKGLVPDVQTTEGIVSNVLSVEDDPSLNPWTFRTFFLGFGLSIFGSVLAEIYYFKPQTLAVSTIFLGIHPSLQG